MTSIRCIAIKNTLGYSVLVFCACELILLFAVAYCLVRVLHKFGLETEHPASCDQWKVTDVE